MSSSYKGVYLPLQLERNVGGYIGQRTGPLGDWFHLINDQHWPTLASAENIPDIFKYISGITGSSSRPTLASAENIPDIFKYISGIHHRTGDQC